MSSAPVSGVHLWLILLKATHAIGATASALLRKSGLGDSEFRVLEVLLHKGALPVNTIGPKVFLTTGSISTAVDRLCEKGLVIKAANEPDKRVHLVELTAKGRRLIRVVFDAHAEHLEQLASVLSSAERTQIAEGLKKLGKHASQSE